MLSNWPQFSGRHFTCMQRRCWWIGQLTLQHGASWCLCRSWWQNLTTQTSINSITTLGQTTSTSPCPMSYSREADFYNPYDRIQLENTSNAAILERDLASVINSFAAQNAHLAVKSPNPSGAMVTQFVSICNSTSGRYSVWAKRLFI